MPAPVAHLTVRRCVPTEYPDCDIIFSGLNSDVAGEVEMAFLKANFAVFSNAKNFRLAPLVPLIVPVVNPGHIESIPTQRRHYQLNKGLLVCNSNCAVVGLVVPAAALIQKFGPIEQVSVVTMQAVSGAGYPGVSSKRSIRLPIMRTRGPYILHITANRVRHGHPWQYHSIHPRRGSQDPR
jgi:aspartate-semialdehyde dehydrogenase